MSENLRSAFQGIWAHKMRSFLTMLGVIIGIAAIIGIVSTIQGTNEQIEKSLIGSGNNNIPISLYSGSQTVDFTWEHPDGVKPFSDKQKEEIRALDGAADATFFNSRNYVDIYHGSQFSESTTVRGVDKHYIQTVGYNLYGGRPFTEEDYTEIRKVAILDEAAVNSLFTDEEPVGSVIEINGEPFTVVGLIKKNEGKKSYSSLMEYTQYEVDSQFATVLIPQACWPTLYAYDEPENCIVRAKSIDDMSTVGAKAEEILNRSIEGYTPITMSGSSAAEDVEGSGDGTESSGSSDTRLR
ncbi:MAG: ABC transporter permease, partial [Eubacterium sp.]|nr:ABC transporter permease [Eubacterium sp.]